MQNFLAIFIATKASRERSDWNALSPDQFAARRSAGVQAWDAWISAHKNDIVDEGSPVGKTKFVEAPLRYRARTICDAEQQTPFPVPK